MNEQPDIIDILITVCNKHNPVNITVDGDSVAGLYDFGSRFSNKLMEVSYKLPTLTNRYRNVAVRFNTSDLVGYSYKPTRLELYVKPDLSIWIDLSKDPLYPILVDKDKNSVDKFLIDGN